MAGIKRKQTLDDMDHTSNNQKRFKREEGRRKDREPIETLETATDSDPIVESDTASQSGEDDGASWPSDGEDEADEEWGGVSIEDNDAVGDLEVVAQAVTGGQPAAKPASTNTVPSTNSSKEAHAKQKVEKQERKAAKPNADSIARSKKIWERLRRKSHVPLEERKKLVAELFDTITGRVKEFVFKHDSVRVIQTALKYANIDQRKMIARELKGEYKVLAESRYAKFLIGKMLVHGDEETRDMVVPEFYGHVRRMMKHPEAAWILDDIYRGIATPSQKATILREWYGAEFALFKSKEKGPISGELQQILSQNPEKRTPILRSLHELVNLLVQKKTTGFTMLHDAMLQYFLNVQPESEEMTECMELLKGDEEGDLVKNLAFTKSGARLMSLALAHGSAKDRKVLLRFYKGTILDLAYDTYGHQVILTAYDVIDDTEMISKLILSDLVGKNSPVATQQRKLLDAATDLNARTALLYLFCGKSKAILSNEDLKLLDEVHRIRTKTSKKDPELRRQQLLSSVAPPLLSLIASKSSLETLISTSFGCQFITEVLLAASDGRGPALDAMADLVKRQDPTTEASPSEPSNAPNKNLLDTPAAGRMLKTLVLGGRFNPSTKSITAVDPPLNFHTIFYESIKKDVVQWATGGNSFVVVGLLEAPGFDQVTDLKAILSEKRNRNQLAEAAAAVIGKGKDDGLDGKAGGANKKARTGKKSEKENDGGTDARVGVGNKGTRLLLQKLFP